MTVTVDRSGAIFIDDARMSFAEFQASIKALAEKKGKAGVYLRADDGVDYGTVVRVLAVIRGAGVADVGLVAEPPLQR
jgi:biopolymer transport protein TolR